jgi:beta-glucanase (GH16 family)
MLAPPPSGAPERRRRRWSIVLLGVLLVLIAGATSVVLVVRANQPGWRVTWRDEFNGNTVQRSHWNVRNDDWSLNEQSIHTDRAANVRVADGHLTLTARRERYTVGNTTREYTSGYLDTIGRHSWKYGRFVMRAKLPVGQGLWPAFWLRTDSGPGEIDIMEAVGGDARRTSQTVHESTDGGQGKVGHEDVLPTGTTAAWHTYALEIEPSKLSWTIDDRTVFEVGADDAPWIRTSFDKPVNIRLNLQVGGTLPAYYGRPVTAATVMPDRFVVDWVRVYQYG